ASLSLASEPTHIYTLFLHDGLPISTAATWSFTTLSAPGPVTLTAPANAATGVSITPTLTWSAATGATSYDVYFGTASTPLLATNVTTTSYSPAALTASTTYFWRVVAKNSAGKIGRASCRERHSAE